MPLVPLKMARTGYFGSANEFNVGVNFLSGNLFPLGAEAGSLSLFSLSWIFFVCSMKLLYFLSTVFGSVYFAQLSFEETLNKSGAIFVVFIELLIPMVYLNLRREELGRLINRYNLVLVDSDDLRKLVRETTEPYKNGLKVYLVTMICATGCWSAAPIFFVFENERFTYANFTVPAYLPGEPFGVDVFLAGIIFQIVGCSSINLGKASIDVYVTHLVAVLSAEYKYLRVRLAQALSRSNHEENEASVIRALQEWVKHHSAVIEIGQGLTKLLAFPIGATYITCILKFCFLAFGAIKIEISVFEVVAYLVYPSACILQVFITCSCIQELLEVSTSVTDDAFHENWHGRSIEVKKMFCTIEASNRMECRLSAYRIVDLVVPTLASILRTSYSVFLLLLEFE